LAQHEAAQKADAFAELVQCLDDRISLSGRVIREAKDDGERAFRSIEAPLLRQGEASGYHAVHIINHAEKVGEREHRGLCYTC
jgi:hypothetical protein